MWSVDATPRRGHADSVEDLQWSPNETTVFMSASADNSVMVWDVRQADKGMLNLVAHDSDVNVISWNRNVSYLVASGADNGDFKIWDLRSFGNGAAPVAHFRWHNAPITSLEWHPTDESVLAVAGDDHQLTCWDMSVEEVRCGGSMQQVFLLLLPSRALCPSLCRSLCHSMRHSRSGVTSSALFAASLWDLADSHLSTIPAPRRMIRQRQRQPPAMGPFSLRSSCSFTRSRHLLICPDKHAWVCLKRGYCVSVDALSSTGPAAHLVV